MLNRQHLVLLTLLLFFTRSFATGTGADVKIWEEDIVIPTYKVDEADKNPRFYTSRNYQGAKGPVYPYPMRDALTANRADKSYKAVYLENQYVKLCVLPEIGGRLFYAIDKTNGYDLFYHQHVIKPALVGMLGAWISGGIEWCIPHHHRATTFMQMDYDLKENADGSKTIWIGEFERRHRMKWSIAITLHPDKSYIQADVKLFNRTPLAHSFLYWANVAVHVNPDYQVIFPPSTEFATYHGKHEFTRWPIGDSLFNGADYRGVDISWYKSHPHATSCFGWEPKEDFFAGYDHGKKAGVVHIANHHIVPGRKLWTFGVNSTTDKKVLTDSDGPYCEIMAGAFSDNQPDYTWIQPYEVKTFTQYWYPLREMGGLKNANLEAAVNFELSPQNTAKVSVNTTAEYRDARVVVKAGDKAVLQKQVTISPQSPFSTQVAVPKGIKAEDCEVTLFSSANEVLISYRPQKHETSPKPRPVIPPPDPKDVKTIEELYFIGLNLTQFHNPILEPNPYFEEALRRDPEDTRVNLMLGIDDYRRGLFESAEKKLQISLRRNTANYTNPKDCEAYYYLGATLKAQERWQEAYDAFYKAAWTFAWKSAACYSLAELDCQKGNFTAALENLDQCLSSNSLNTRALNLKAAILRQLGKYEDAIQCAAKSGTIDELDWWSKNEMLLSEIALGDETQAKKTMAEITKLMRGDEQLYLELAVDYSNCGLLNEAIDVLSRLDISANKDGNSYPLIYYYLGYLWECKGDPAKASQYYLMGSKMPPDYCFPFRLETIRVLQSAMQNNPSDARAHYYLGDLLFDLQAEAAIKEWEKSRELDSSFYLVHRNLGFAYSHIEKNLEKAIASLSKAIALNDEDPRIYYELDVLQERAGMSPEERLKDKRYETMLKRDDILSRCVGLFVQVGQYDKAIQTLTTHRFNTWEGESAIHDVHVNAHLLRGMQSLRAGKYPEAIDDFTASLDYPENLGVDRPLNDIQAARAFYLLATSYDRQGNGSKAKEYLRKALATKVGESQFLYYQGLAAQKLGQKDKAKKLFEQLIVLGSKKLKSGAGIDFFAKFGEKESSELQLAPYCYMVGLGHLGLGDLENARKYFNQTLKMNRNFLWAQVQLSELN